MREGYSREKVKEVKSQTFIGVEGSPQVKSLRFN